jgi:O-antigen/teichoic acid export membrane protein
MFRIGSFGRNVGILATSTAIAQAIALMAAPLLTRLYTPSDFGALGIFVSIVGSLQVLGMLGYHRAIPLPKEEKEGVVLMVLSGIILAVMVSIISLGVYLLGDSIVVWINTPILSPYLWLIPVGLVFVGSYEILTAWTVRNKIFKILARTKLRQGAGMVMTQIGMGLSQLGTLGLIVGELLGRSLGIVTLLLPFLKECRERILKVNIQDLQNMLLRYRRFPGFYLPFLFFNQMGLRLPTILFAALYSPTVAGLLVLGDKILQTPLTFIGRSIARVYMGEASDIARCNPEQLRIFFQKTLRRLIFIAVLPISMITIAGPYLFGIVFGETWREAGSFVRLLGFPFFLQFTIAPMAQTLIIIERQDTMLMWGVLRFVLIVGGISAARLFDLSETYAVIFYGIGVVISYSCLYFILDKYVRTEAQSRK